MNNVPIGSMLIVKENGEEVELLKIFHFPTTFKTISKNGVEKIYKTHEIEVVDHGEDE